jgi:hypothetical protein
MASGAERTAVTATREFNDATLVRIWGSESGRLVRTCRCSSKLGDVGFLTLANP